MCSYLLGKHTHKKIIAMEQKPIVTKIGINKVSLVGNLNEFDVLHPTVLEIKSTGITIYQNCS